MDFRLYAQVLYRHKVLVIGGLVLALLLAELSVVSVSTNGSIRYRHSQLWSSTTQVAIGKPQGNRIIPTRPNYNYLAVPYAFYATSDQVRSLIGRDGPLRGDFDANPVTDSGGNPQAFIDISAISKSPKDSFELAGRAVRALQTYLKLELSPSDYVPITPIKRNPPVVFKARSKTLPVLIFLAVTFAFVGLAFVLDNVKERDRELDEPEPGREDHSDHIEARPVGVEPQASERRRSA